MTEFATIDTEASLSAITAFDGARDSTVPAERLEEVRSRARAFRSKMLGAPKARYYKACELVRVPYPTRYAFANCFTQAFVKTPVLHIVNRLFVIQYDSPDGLKTLLFSPSDIMANAETRFFKRLGGGGLAKAAAEAQAGGGGAMSGVFAFAQKLVAPIKHTVDEWLAELGLAPEDIDYLSYDHLHTQDVRNWLGSSDRAPYFPNAKLLVMREEWDAAQGLVAPQLDWYCPSGIDGIDPSRVVLLDNSVRLGEGVALVKTPGHTMGNHSLVVHTDDGLLVSSENGVSADAYAPESSSITAVRKYQQATKMEVVINGNTQESGLEQYISMVMEKEIAGPSPLNPSFANVFPSSEFAAHWLFPGIKPTFTFGDREYGTLQRDLKRAAA